MINSTDTYRIVPADAGRWARAGSADLYHGTVSMFERAGCTEMRRPRPARRVKRLRLG